MKIVLNIRQLKKPRVIYIPNWFVTLTLKTGLKKTFAASEDVTFATKLDRKSIKAYRKAFKILSHNYKGFTLVEVHSSEGDISIKV